MTFTCSTLRKQLRVICITGNSLGAEARSSFSTGAGSASSILAERAREQSLNVLAHSPLVESSEPADYFGDTTSSANPDTAVSPLHLSSPSMAVESIMSPPRQAMISAQRHGLTAEMLNTRDHDGSSFDWTRLPFTPALPRHIQFTRSIDWASTPLGPIETWTFDLRAMCNLIMGSPHVCCLLA